MGRLENLLREHCRNLDWKRFAEDREYHDRMVRKAKELSMIEANGRKWHVDRVEDGREIWVTEATEEDLKEIRKAKK